jgi:hypothetical protein
MTTPTVTQLTTDPQYEQLAEIGHKTMMPFLLEYYLRRLSLLLVLHYAITLAVFVGWVWVSVQSPAGLGGSLGGLGLALLAFLVIVPLHELIHGLAYRATGATDVRYGMSVREATAYAVAHNFVADWRAFTFVAVAPFVVITTALLLAILVWPAQHLFLFTVLLLHTTATLGDCALLNYFWVNRRRTLYTYDDADKKLSYIYARRD